MHFMPFNQNRGDQTDFGKVEYLSRRRRAEELRILRAPQLWS